MKLLITGEILSSAPTGVEHYLRQLLAALSQRGDINITVLLTHESLAPSLPEGCHWIVEPPLAGTNIFGYWARPPRCLEDFELIHCPTVHPTPFLREAPWSEGCHDCA